MGSRESRLKGNGFLQVIKRFRCLAFGEQSVAEIHVRLSHVRLEGEPAPEFTDGLVRPPRMEEGTAEVVMSAGGGWLQPDGFLELGNCFFQVALLAQSVPKVVVSVSRVGLDGDGLPQVKDGLFEASLPEQRRPKVAVNVRGVGFESHGLTEVSDGVVDLSLREEQRSEVVVRDARCGIPRNGCCP